MNNHIFNSLFPIILSFIFTSCEEVIVLDLDTVEEQIVIEANLNVTDSTCTVLISKSQDFYTDNSFQKITGANISLTTDSGIVYTLNDMGDGQYFASDIMTIANENITIDINLPDNLSFSATAIVPKPIILDTLLIEENSGGFGPNETDENYSLTVEWMDPEGEDNFYRLKIFRNGVYQSGVYALADDRLGDGDKLTRPIIGERYAKSDELRVQLLSVNKGYYDYFFDIANAEERGLSSAVPFNPRGNIDPEVRGCFGVWTVSEKVIVVE